MKPLSPFPLPPSLLPFMTFRVTNETRCVTFRFSISRARVRGLFRNYCENNLNNFAKHTIIVPSITGELKFNLSPNLVLYRKREKKNRQPYIKSLSKRDDASKSHMTAAKLQSRFKAGFFSRRCCRAHDTRWVSLQECMHQASYEVHTRAHLADEWIDETNREPVEPVVSTGCTARSRIYANWRENTVP